MTSWIDIDTAQQCETLSFGFVKSTTNFRPQWIQFWVFGRINTDSDLALQTRTSGKFCQRFWHTFSEFSYVCTASAFECTWHCQRFYSGLAVFATLQCHEVLYIRKFGTCMGIENDCVVICMAKNNACQAQKMSKNRRLVKHVHGIYSSHTQLLWGGIPRINMVQLCGNRVQKCESDFAGTCDVHAHDLPTNIWVREGGIVGGKHAFVSHHQRCQKGKLHHSNPLSPSTIHKGKTKNNSYSLFYPNGLFCGTGMNQEHILQTVFLFDLSFGTPARPTVTARQACLITGSSKPFEFCCDKITDTVKTGRAVVLAVYGQTPLFFAMHVLTMLHWTERLIIIISIVHDVCRSCTPAPPHTHTTLLKLPPHSKSFSIRGAKLKW